MSLLLERVASLQPIEPGAWNALAGDSPFLRHEFLTALERSGCVGRRTAWQPAYLLAKEGAELIGAIPLYMKYDSRGEFVFDWGWADAYERSGRRYYPKLVAAVPFTPATGAAAARPTGRRRAARARAVDRRRARGGDRAPRVVRCTCCSRSRRSASASTAAGLLSRKACQFHWHNDGYTDFDDFLARFSSAKRKKAKRERRRVAEAEIAFEHLRGDEPSDAEWDAIFEFYSRTFERRGRPPYLNRAFFAEIARTMPENLVVILARFRGTADRVAICFRGGDTLYGRYWGSAADFHSLHFETCYYQGIDYCIRERLAKFEPGTQGEHKISRGFTPSVTWSCHWLATATSTRRLRTSSRARPITSTPTWTSSTSTCRTATTRCRRSRHRSAMTTLRWLSSADAADRFPPASHALTEPNGLLAAGGDLSPKRLLAAYRRGIFPWYEEGQPILWWSPDPARCCGRTAARCRAACAGSLNKGGFELRSTRLRRRRRGVRGAAPLHGRDLDHAEMAAAYTRLHGLGWAHSFESWRDGGSSAGSTVSRSAACSLASRCSRA